MDFGMKARRLVIGLGICLALAATFSNRASADQNYSQQVFFDNSLSPDNYYYSGGRASYPSQLKLVNDKLPVETSSFVSAPNALALDWTSNVNGGWAAEIRLYEWRNRAIEFPGDYLWIWAYAPEGLRAQDMPRLALRAAYRRFSAPIDLSSYTADLPPGKWTRIQIPLNAFHSAGLEAFDPHSTNALIFSQGSADKTHHVVYLDDIRIENPAQLQGAMPAPINLKAKGYERHIDLTWNAVENPDLAQYVIYRSIDGGRFLPVGVQRPGVQRYSDYVGNPRCTATYKITARTSSLVESAPSPVARASTHPMSDDELLTMVQEASFRYYWEAAEPHSGMTRENTPGDDDVVALGASGFGIMAIVVGANRGFITHEQAMDRLLRITQFLAHADRYHGAWPHFLSGSTGHRLPVFDMYDNGADLVETSFLMEGLLTARQYFKQDGATGNELFQRITALWEGVEWSWFSSMPSHDALYWHWSPEYSFYIANRLTGWNEVMITYLEAIASPTHSVPANEYYSGFAGEGIRSPYANGKTYFEIKLDVGEGTGGPLFFTDYSFMGFDPHSLTDRFTNYFENNHNIARINHAYCMQNPNHWKGYGQNWGLTAVDGPDGYNAYEPTPRLDDGTIAPTGAVSAMPYTPELSMAAIRHLYRDLGAQVWDIYGFRDAFNMQQNWYSGITMGLNQAPMTVMIENYRTGLVWRNFMANPEIALMINRIRLAHEGQ